MESKEDVTSSRDAVNQAIAAGTTESLDMVIRARYACEWGNGDALHRELADEVEKLRAIVRQSNAGAACKGGRGEASDSVTPQGLQDQHPEDNSH